MMTKRINKLGLLLPFWGILIFAFPWFLQAEVIESIGTTYEIVEENLLEKVQKKAALLDWKKESTRVHQNLLNYQPAERSDLPQARRDRKFSPDLSYTLPFPIRDHEGTMIYPQGFKFNPMEYIHFSQTLVVINGEEEKQLRWFRETYNDRLDVMLLLTKGSYHSLSKQLMRPAFYLSPQITERFQLRAVPSVIWQEGKKLWVQEVVELSQ